jgi:RHS repeat-associated protein
MEAALHAGSLLAAGLLQPLSENSRPGHQLSTVALYPGIGFVNSNTATGLRVCLYDDGRRSRDTGKERDSESGLDYFGARYYGGALGRWTSPDWSATPAPIPYADLKNPQSLNLYNYMRNNPLGGVDSDGHCCEEEPEPREEVEREEEEMAEFGREARARDTAAARAEYMRTTTPEQREKLDEAIAHGMDHNLDQHRAEFAEFVKQQTKPSESAGMEKTEHGQQRADEARQATHIGRLVIRTAS